MTHSIGKPYMPKVFSISLIGLFGVLSLMITSFICLDISMDLTLKVPLKSYKMQVQDLELIQDFICLISRAIMNEEASSGHETFHQSIVQLLLNFWKWETMYKIQKLCYCPKSLLTQLCILNTIKTLATRDDVHVESCLRKTSASLFFGWFY